PASPTRSARTRSRSPRAPAPVSRRAPPPGAPPPPRDAPRPRRRPRAPPRWRRRAAHRPAATALRSPLRGRRADRPRPSAPQRSRAPRASSGGGARKRARDLEQHLRERDHVQRDRGLAAVQERDAEVAVGIGPREHVREAEVAEGGGVVGTEEAHAVAEHEAEA